MDNRIHQEFDFRSSPAQVYRALLDDATFGGATGAAAQIQPEAGGAFTLFGGRVSGRIVELVPDRRIVQAWRVEAWPPGAYSIVRFDLDAHGSGARLALDHTGFPPENHKDLDEGWPRMYWNPLARYLDM